MRRASATIASIMITAITLLLGCGGPNPISTIQSEEPSVSSPPSDCVHPRGPTVIVVGTKDAEPLRSFLCDAGITVPPIRLTLPSDLGDANAIIVDDSANVSPSDAPTLEKFCEKGKGVVLVGHIPAKLATGNIVPENGEIDISSIASWFGGARRMQRYKAGVYVRDPYPLFSLPSGVQPNNLIHSHRGEDPGMPSVRALGPGAVIVAADNYNNLVLAFAYRQCATGGRLYWQWSHTGNGPQERVKDVFLVGVKWAAGQ